MSLGNVLKFECDIPEIEADIVNILHGHARLLSSALNT